MINISCVIPTCDRPQLLPETLNSVLAQSFPASEIIVVNNGIDQISLPAIMAGRVKVYNIIPYALPAQARNFGASLATGHYLAFLDDDDLWPVDYLKNILPTIEQGANIVLSRIDTLKKDGQIHQGADYRDKISLEHILLYNPGTVGSNLVISKKIFYELGGYDPKLPPSEDKGLIVEALIKKINIVNLYDNAIILREHGGLRITNATKLAEGVFQFTRKYRQLMTSRQLLANWLKIHRLRLINGNKKSLIPYIILKLVNILIKLI